MAKNNEEIGDYKDNAVYNKDVIVKTSGGTIVFLQAMVIRQFESPESIIDAELVITGTGFKTLG